MTRKILAILIILQGLGDTSFAQSLQLGQIQMAPRQERSHPLTNGAPPPPAGWEEYLELEQLDNVDIYAFTTVPDSQRVFKPLYHFDVPLELAEKLNFGVRHHDFKDGNRDIDNALLVKKDGRITGVRVFTFNPRDEVLRVLYEKGLRPQQNYFASRMRGTNSFFVYDPRIRARPFVMKFDSRFGYEGGIRAVKFSEYLEKSIEIHPPGMVAMFPETSAVGFNSGGKHYFCGVRTLDVVGRRTDIDTELLPAHGLLGNYEKIREIAARQHPDWTPQQWVIREFMKKYGQYMAELHYVHGVDPECHTQNLAVLIDKATGEVKQFVGKDFSHDLVDPLIVNMNPQLADLAKQVMPVSNDFSGGLDARKSRFYTHAAKTILDPLADRYDQAAAAKTFLDSYLESVREINGFDLPAPKEFTDAIKKFEDAYYLEPYSHFRPGDWADDIGAAVKSVQKLAAEKMIGSENLEFKRAGDLAPLIDAKLWEGKLVKFSDGPLLSGSSDLVAVQDDKIVVKSKNGKTLKGYVYGVTPEQFTKVEQERAALEAAKKAAKIKPRCEVDLEGVIPEMWLP